MTARALFLDRDGIINVDRGFVHRIEDVEFVPGIFELAAYAAGRLHWKLIVATNQSGIGRGLFSEAAFERTMAWIRERFAEAGAPLAGVYHCPYHPTEGVGHYRADHPWRKPHPGMILAAAKDHDIDLAGSVLLGDQERDIAAGRAAGVGTLILLQPGAPGRAEGDCIVIAHLGEAIPILARIDERSGEI